MKTTVLSLRLVCLVTVLAAVAACEDEKKDDTVAPTPTPLRIEEIIVNPRAAAPGDTVTLTADVRSSSPNVGDIPRMKWTASGGTFVADDKTTVQWAAPLTAGFYTVTAKATNDANSVTSQGTVFVGTQALLVANEAGAVRMQSNGEDFYYQRTQDINSNDANINGAEAFKYVGGIGSDAALPTRSNGRELSYAPTLAFEVHAENVNAPESLGIATANPRPRQVYMGDLTLGTTRRISQDLSALDSARRNQFAYPSVSPDGQMITFQGTVTNGFSSSLDSIDVFVYWPTGPVRVRATGAHTNHKNYFPTFSTDQNWLTFVSDRGGSNQWEIYAMPVSGTTLDTNPASVVRLTDTGGTITSTLSGGVPARPLRAWNPVASTLAILAGDNIVYLMSTSGGGATLTDITGLPASVQELVWSPDGVQLAVVATGKDADNQTVMQIYTVGGFSAQLRFQGLPGDLVRDVVFSPAGDWMVFRITRGGLGWFEIMDLGAGVLNETVSVTGVFPASEASSYRSIMSLSPAWGAGDKIYAPVFMGTSKTPSIISVDLSAAIN